MSTSNQVRRIQAEPQGDSVHIVEVLVMFQLRRSIVWVKAPLIGLLQGGPSVPRLSRPEWKPLSRSAT